MLRKTRVILAAIIFCLITLLFLDFTGTLHSWFGWLAKIQFLPALLALNAGIVIGLLALTFLLGRVYCSVICPLGIFQDIISWGAGKRKRNRFQYAPARNIVRYSILALFMIALVAGINAFVVLLSPYSAYGRIASNLLAPIYQWGNNTLAYFAQRFDSYQFYNTEVWMKSISSFIVAVITLVVLSILAWLNGRTYCNTICPVGTLLGFVSRYSWFRPVIDTSKCNNCGMCARNCKAACINPQEHQIDYSRCVSCMDCLEKCKKGAIHYEHPTSIQEEKNEHSGASGRRSFLTIASLFVLTAFVKAQKKKVDGGLAIIQDKKIPKRLTPITPVGSLSARHLQQHCTACQLCIAACPNDVLRPSSDVHHFMQPEVSYERGYCRPECTACGSVCPTGAIRPISKPDKTATQVGHAVWIAQNCIALTDQASCGNCARHCPSGAIQMVPSDANNPESARIPAINIERCIGCGACENLCPARPFSAIYVEGHEVHRTI